MNLTVFKSVHLKIITSVSLSIKTHKLDLEIILCSQKYSTSFS